MVEREEREPDDGSDNGDASDASESGDASDGSETGDASVASVGSGDEESAQVAAAARPENPGAEDDGYIPPGRMGLSEREKRWAKDIKETIEAIPELDNLSDFWYVQLALIEHDNVEAAVERVRGLQIFREEYGLMDKYEEGQAMLWKAIKLFPRHLLSYSYNERDDINVLIVDMAEFNMEILSNPEKVRTWVAGVYYLNQAICEDFKSIRKGFHMFCECEGYTFGSGVKFSIAQKIYTELVNFYPVKPYEIKHFNTGVIFHTVASMMKKFMPAEFRRAFIIGCKFDRRLDTIYLTPTVEAANKRVGDQLCSCLKQRYKYENSFKLIDNYANY